MIPRAVLAIKISNEKKGVLDKRIHMVPWYAQSFFSLAIAKLLYFEVGLNFFS